VFRNQQGVFLPAMSDSKEVHVWRILKKGASPGDKVNIVEGDEIQLAWCFQDQYCGYRDFTQDVFGRRRTSTPTGITDTILYLRLPWPRFEPVDSIPQQEVPLPNTMVMSGVSKPLDNNIPGVLHDQIRCVLGSGEVEKSILVEDCIFRLDLVNNHGRGDVDDYLLRGVSQRGCFESTILEEEAKVEAIKRHHDEEMDEERQKQQIQHEREEEAEHSDEEQHTLVSL
jgi:hypothetical protein